jgi:hypothetical protein
MLPALTRDLHTSIDAGRDDAELLRIASLLYPQAVPGWLFAVHASGDGDLAWQAACMGLDAAQRLDEAVALGVATFGYPTACWRVVDSSLPANCLMPRRKPATTSWT